MLNYKSTVVTSGVLYKTVFCISVLFEFHINVLPLSVEKIFFKSAVHTIGKGKRRKCYKQQETSDSVWKVNTRVQALGRKAGRTSVNPGLPSVPAPAPPAAPLLLGPRLTAAPPSLHSSSASFQKAPEVRQSPEAPCKSPIDNPMEGTVH